MALRPIRPTFAPGMAQGTSIKARAGENIAGMFNRALTGAGRDIGAGMARGKARRQQEAQFQQQMDFRKSDAAQRYGLMEQAQRMEAIKFGAGMVTQRLNTALNQRERADAALKDLQVSGVAADAPSMQAAMQKLQTADDGVASAQQELSAISTRGMNFAQSFNAAMNPEANCSGGT